MSIIPQFFKIVNFISILPQEKKKAQMSGRIEIIIKQTVRRKNEDVPGLDHKGYVFHTKGEWRLNHRGRRTGSFRND